MLKSILSLIFLSSVAPSPALAQDLPRFDGVYLGLKDGSFIELNPFVGNQLILDDLGYGAAVGVQQLLVAKIFNRVAFEPDILSAGFFDTSNIESIFIRSRSNRLQFLEIVTLTKNISDERASSEDDVIRNERVRERLESDFAYLSSTTCGWDASSTNILNESDTTYQYFVDEGKFDYGGEDISLFIQDGGSCRKANEGEGRAVGLLLKTMDGDYLILESDSMRDYYLPENSTGWKSLSDLEAKIKLADR